MYQIFLAFFHQLSRHHLWLSGTMWLFLTNGFEWKWYLQVQHFMAFVVLSVTLSLWYGNLLHLRCCCLIFWVPGLLRWRKLPIDLQWTRKKKKPWHLSHREFELFVSTVYFSWWYFSFHSASLDVFNNTKSLQFFISHFSLHHNSCHPLLRTSAIIYSHVKGRWNHWWGKLAIMNWIQRKASTVKT